MDLEETSKDQLKSGQDLARRRLDFINQAHELGFTVGFNSFNHDEEVWEEAKRQTQTQQNSIKFECISSKSPESSIYIVEYHYKELWRSKEFLDDGSDLAELEHFNVVQIMLKEVSAYQHMEILKRYCELKLDSPL